MVLINADTEEKKMLKETYQFDNLDSLRTFLNAFTVTDLTLVYPEGADYINLEWHVETMSDGSSVNNVRITTP